jgi:hypothetical protein
MFLRSFRVLSVSGILAIAGSASTAFGQCWPFNACCCCPAPVRVTACYHTVPVTEMREVRQTVQRPVVETTYVDQPVTEYRQVVENKSAEIPTCTLQNVTEMRTVQRDCGHWVAQLHERPMISPCQYDSRPDVFGFMNRTGYSLRMAFTPRYWTERMYVPNVVAEQVPVTRQVAVRGTQTINYQVAKMVPITTTRKVAVNTVKMVAQEIVTQRPVTVFKTVPMGSSLAFGIPAAAPTTTTALQPTPSSEATAIMPKNSGKGPSPERISKNPASLNADDEEGDAFNSRSSNSRGSKTPRKTDPENGSIKVPAATDDEVAPASASDEEEIAGNDSRPIGRWVARKQTKSVSGPAFPEVAQAATTVTAGGRGWTNRKPR